MRSADDPLRADNVREAAVRRRHVGPNAWLRFRRIGQEAKAANALLRQAEDVHDDAFVAGVAYALRAVRKGSKA